MGGNTGRSWAGRLRRLPHRSFGVDVAYSGLRAVRGRFDGGADHFERSERRLHRYLRAGGHRAAFLSGLCT